MGLPHNNKNNKIIFQMSEIKQKSPDFYEKIRAFLCKMELFLCFGWHRNLMQ